MIIDQWITITIIFLDLQVHTDVLYASLQGTWYLLII